MRSPIYFGAYSSASHRAQESLRYATARFQQASQVKSEGLALRDTKFSKVQSITAAFGISSRIDQIMPQLGVRQKQTRLRVSMLPNCTSDASGKAPTIWLLVTHYAAAGVLRCEIITRTLASCRRAAAYPGILGSGALNSRARSTC